MRARLILILAVSCSLALTGCFPGASYPESSPPASTASDTSATPAPTSSPVAAPLLTVTLDGVVYSHDNTTKLFPLTDGRQVVDLFTIVTGVMPAGEPITGYYDPDVEYGTTYDWGVVSVNFYNDGRPCYVTITAATINGVPIRTAEGIAVGSPQSDVVAAGGWPTNPGFTDAYGLGSREVSGTASLMHDGAVGVEYIDLIMGSGSVRQIVLLDNDYSDL